jgi:hypothetical protein
MSAAPIGVSPRSSADRASAKAMLIGSPPFPSPLDIALPTPASPRSAAKKRFSVGGAARSGLGQAVADGNAAQMSGGTKRT